MADLSCVATIVKIYLSVSASTANVCSTVCVPCHLLTGHSRDLKPLSLRPLSSFVFGTVCNTGSLWWWIFSGTSSERLHACCRHCLVLCFCQSSIIKTVNASLCLSTDSNENSAITFQMSSIAINETFVFKRNTDANHKSHTPGFYETEVIKLG